MLTMKWMMNNDGRLVATGKGTKQARNTPSYLTAETAIHTAGYATLRAQRRLMECVAMASLRVLGWRVSEFADNASLPRQKASSKVTGPHPIPPLASIQQINGGNRPLRQLGFVTMTRTIRGTLVLAILLTSLCNVAWADLGGKISGVVTDPSDAAMAGAVVVVRNIATGAEQQTHTDAEGSYTFPVLAVGQYEIEVSFPGFKPCRQAGLVIDIGSAQVVGAKMQLGEQSQTVTVIEASTRVESSDTQLGQVIASKQVTEVPLMEERLADRSRKTNFSSSAIIRDSALCRALKREWWACLLRPIGPAIFLTQPRR